MREFLEIGGLSSGAMFPKNAHRTRAWDFKTLHDQANSLAAWTNISFFYLHAKNEEATVG